MYLAIKVYNSDNHQDGVWSVVGIFDNLELAKEACQATHNQWLNAPMLIWETPMFSNNSERAKSQVSDTSVFYDVTFFALNQSSERSSVS